MDKKASSSQNQFLIDHFGLEMLPEEGMYFKNTYTSKKINAEGSPLGTAMIGLFCHEPLSYSRFHRLAHDEVWHFYLGDTIELYVLHPGGTLDKILLGSSLSEGQCLQYMVPAFCWQAAKLNEEGNYALFGCTMAPGFGMDIFEAADRERLIAEFPLYQQVIHRFT